MCLQVLIQKGFCGALVDTAIEMAFKCLNPHGVEVLEVVLHVVHRFKHFMTVRVDTDHPIVRMRAKQMLSHSKPSGVRLVTISLRTNV